MSAALAAIRPAGLSRSLLEQHARTTLSHDLMYLLYSHSQHTTPRPSPKLREPRWNPTNPYAANRPPPQPKGGRRLVPNPDYTSSSTVPRLERITISTMSKDAVGNKNALIPLIHAYQSITHLSPSDIEITKSSKASASFKIRPGMPTGVKATLHGDDAYDFLHRLTTFVLPRVKTFTGLPVPTAKSRPPQSPAAIGGVVSFGLEPGAMAFFPEIESELDKYPRMWGFNIYAVTTARGRGAQEQARAVLSGLGLPFKRQR